MSVQTAFAIALVVGFAAAQYILTIQALRDLRRRPRVRGGNKVAWGLLILCVPIAGALVYGWMGPTSLLRRPRGTSAESTVRRSVHTPARIGNRRNITSISEARSSRTATPRPAPRRFSRTGS
jgi:hypothetical protein